MTVYAVATCPVKEGEGEAESQEARERIRAAAQAIVRSQTKEKRAGKRALERWRQLVSARWTLVDGFEDDGKQYILVRENQARGDHLDRLADREREVVLQALLGLNNKEIAGVLGISASTVRVLMSRAAKKLGVRSREELVSLPALSGIRD